MSLESAFKTISCTTEVIEDTDPYLWYNAAQNKYRNKDLEGALHDINRAIYYYGNSVDDECKLLKINIAFEFAEALYSKKLYSKCVEVLDNEFLDGNYDSYKKKVNSLKLKAYLKNGKYLSAFYIFVSTNWLKKIILLAISIALLVSSVVGGMVIYSFLMGDDDKTTIQINNEENILSDSYDDKTVDNFMNEAKFDDKFSDDIKVEAITKIKMIANRVSNEVNNIVNSDSMNTLLTIVNRSDESELSIGEIFIGDDRKNIEEILGSPYDSDVDGKYRHSYYDDIEVIYYNDKAVRIVSYSTVYATRKGLCVGDDEKYLSRLYGDSNENYPENDLQIYDYEFYSRDGRKGLLRFAISLYSHKIVYISTRILDK